MPGFTMEGENSPLPQRRDINELLTTGSFKTARGKSPGPASNVNAPSFLRPVENDARWDRSRSRHGSHAPSSNVPMSKAPSFLRPVEHDAPRHRSRSRGRFQPPPRPTAEDEEISLRRESYASRNMSWQSYDPPVKGIVDQNPIILEADVTSAEAARLQQVPCAKDEEDERMRERKSDVPKKERKDDNSERRFVLIPKSDTYNPNEESEVESKGGKKDYKSSSDGSAVGLGYKSSSGGSEARRVQNDNKVQDGRRVENGYASSNDRSEVRRAGDGHKVSHSGSETRRGDNEYRSSNDWSEASRGEKMHRGGTGAKRGDKSHRSPNEESESRRGERSNRSSNGEDEAESRRTERSSRISNGDPRKEVRGEPTRLDRPLKETRRTSYRGEAPPLDERRQSERPETERRRSRQDLPVIETKIPRDIPPQFRRSLSAMSSSAGNKVAFATPGTPAEIFLSPDVIRPPKDFQHAQPSVPRGNLHEALWGKTPTPIDKQRNVNGPDSRSGTSVAEKRSSSSLEIGGRPPAEKLTRPQQLVGETVGRRQERRHSPAGSTRSSTHSAHDYSGSDNDSLESDSDHHTRHRRRHQDKEKRRSPSRSNRSSNRSSLDVKGTSRFSTPLPSPKLSPSRPPNGERYERAETFPTGRKEQKPVSRPVSPFSAEVMDNTNLKSRQTSTMPNLKPLTPFVPLGIIPTVMPILNSSRESARQLVQPPYEDSRLLGPRPIPQAQPQAQQKPFWQPPSFQPPPQDSEKPKTGSFRRFSEDVERGQIVPLPTCPRTAFSRGRNDWLSLPQIGEFDICPQCFDLTMAPTKFRDLFVPVRRNPETLIRCDFGSSPWYRIAWLLTLKEKRLDLSLFYGLAEVAYRYAACQGKNASIQQWYSVIDPRSGGPVKDFDVCLSCVKSVEVLLPAVKGCFVNQVSYGNIPRVCDLRFDSKRFVLYFDALETTADRSKKYAPLDTRELARLCRKLAGLPECQQDVEISNGKWHTITQLPEFTVCEDCFDEFVGPDIDDGKPIANLFSTKAKLLPRGSCQLYGKKMRGIFRVAVDGDDYRYLATKARERRKAEDEYKRAIAELERQPPGNPCIEREIKRRQQEWSLWER